MTHGEPLRPVIHLNFCPSFANCIASTNEQPQCRQNTLLVFRKVCRLPASPTAVFIRPLSSILQMWPKTLNYLILFLPCLCFIFILLDTMRCVTVWYRPILLIKFTAVYYSLLTFLQIVSLLTLSFHQICNIRLQHLISKASSFVASATFTVRVSAAYSRRKNTHETSTPTSVLIFSSALLSLSLF